MGSIPARGRPAVALPFASSDSHLDKRRSISPSNSSSSTASTSGTSITPSQQAMPIPGVQQHIIAPPPLPPPTYNHDLANGRDLAWTFGNSGLGRNHALPAIKKGSSLLGGFSRTVPQQQQQQQQQSSLRSAVDLEHDDSGERRGNSTTFRTSLPTSEASGGSLLANTTRRAPSPTTNAMLHSDKPLAQGDINRSNQAYDQALLSKIGKPTSPTRHKRSDSAESPVLCHKLSLQTKDMKGLQPPGPAEHSATTTDASSRWPTSPASTAASPFTRQTLRDCVPNPRSPMVDTISNATALDPELFVTRSVYYRSTTSSHTGAEDLNNRSGRSSYDQAMYTPASESGEGNPDDHVYEKGTTRQGVKRKSPPSEEDRPRSDLHPRLTTRIASHSPNSNTAQHPGSFASTPSSAQQSSYTSSGAFSIAQGSITSQSSLDTQSPRDPLHTGSYITTATPVASPNAFIAPKTTSGKLSPHEMSGQQLPDLRPAPARIGNHYICACCPKKPKKFETEEQLKAHESEKQYSCHYCHNRFKNKNEAERHQNSLHLRLHSWSCAALENYQAAFNPSGALDSNNAAVDACGYCGEEFPNHPSPNWEYRLEHLTTVHKFGECNSTKKFFRADHFRQHLKHSHAGKSGKWTNILEHACVRDEIPPEAPGYQHPGPESRAVR